MIKLLVVLALATATKGLRGLRIQSIEVPSAVMNSSQVTLVCDYHLQGDQLYSVKWYKNYVEFYRYQPASQLSAESSKQEFELDGINLNLPRSNSTHVYLRQSSLATEGTYKCEVSADSPSFATVSLERHMKVYVLPKLKLSIVDNSISTTAAISNSSSQTHLAEQHATSKPTAVVYNLDDVLNLTCTASPSRPGAKLIWLINDSPVPESSKWLSVQSRQDPSGQLIESKLTLAFLLQASHLIRNFSNIPDNHQIHRYQSLRLRCLAKLSFEFQTETHILVSGGKTTIKKRQQSQQPLSLSDPSQLQNKQTEQIAHKHIQQSIGSTDYPVYRWPRPPSSSRHNSPTRTLVESPVEAWASASSGSTNSTSLREDEPDWPFRVVSGRMPGSSSRQLVQMTLWTNRQLRAQSEHIDQMLRLAHPNELDAPVIEAKIHLPEPESNEETSFDDSVDSQTSSSSTETWDATREGHSMLREELPRDRDFELNDVVQFTCSPRLGNSNKELAKHLHLKWFINNKEISVPQVNAYNGTRFYHERNLHNTRRHSLGQPRVFSSGNTVSESSTNTDLTDHMFNPNTPSDDWRLLPRRDQAPNDKSLLVEFTPSLFQLKELNLMCRTLLDQPLIEYESQLIVSVPTSQFIQADQHHRYKTSSVSISKNQGQTLNARNNRTSGYNQKKNKNGFLGLSIQSSASALMPVVWSHCIKVAMLAYSFRCSL